MFVFHSIEDFLEEIISWIGAFDRDKSVSGHSLTIRETISVSSAEIDGATAYEVSGTFCDLLNWIYEMLQDMIYQSHNWAPPLS